MILLRTELCNFGQYGHEEIFYPWSGFIGIIGENGTGKSTIMNTLKFGFYNEADTNKDLIKNQQAPARSKCYVEIDFIYQGNFYRVHRNLNSTKTYLKKNGVQIAQKTREVDEEIKKLFRMNFETFKTCFYAQQGEFDSLVSITDAKRVEIITKLLDIQALKDAAKQARDIYRTLDTQVTEAKRHLINEEDVTKRIQELVKQMKEQVEIIKAAEKQIKETEKVMSKLEAEKEKQNKKREKHVSLMTEVKVSENEKTFKESTLKEKENKLVQLQHSKKRYEEISYAMELQPKLVKQKDELTDIRSKYIQKVRLEKEVEEIKKQMIQYKNNYDKIIEELKSYENVEETTEKLKQTMKEQQELMQTLRSDFEKYKVLKETKEKEKKKEEEKLKKFQTLGLDAPCPTCEQPIGEKHYKEHIDAIELQIENIQKEIEMFQSKQKEVYDQGIQKKEEYVRLENELKAWHQKEIKGKSLETARDGLLDEVRDRRVRYDKVQKEYEIVKDVTFNEETYQQVEKELQETNKLYAECIGIHKEILEIPTVLENIQILKQEIEAFQVKIEAYKKEIEELNFSQELYDKLDDGIKDVNKKQTALKEDKKEKEFMLERLKMQKEAEEKAIEEQKEKRKEIKEKEQQMLEYKITDEALKGFEKDTMGRRRPELNGIMSKLMDHVTNGLYDLLELDENFKLFMYRRGIKNPLSFYSGGEQKLAALILRIAISNVLVGLAGNGKMELLAMDEVFGAMDDKRQDNMMDALRNLNGIYKQVVMISHSDNVKESFDYTLKVTRTEKGFSKVAWTREWDQESVKEYIRQYEELGEVS